MKQPLDDFSEPHEWWVYFMLYTFYVLLALVTAFSVLVVLDEIGLLYPIAKWLDKLI